MQDSVNDSVKFVANLVVQDNQSILRKNLNYICEKFDLNITDVGVDKLYPTFICTQDWKSDMINEIIDTLDDEIDIDFEFSNLNDILITLTTF